MSRIWDYDIWFQLACGRAIVALHGLPSHDLFSFTATDHAWDTQEWLSQLLFYGFWRLGGLTLLTVAKALAVAGLCAILWRDTMRGTRPSAGWISLGVITAGVYVMRWHLVERPQTISMLLLAFELSILRGGGARWPIIPLTLAWANLHGGSALIGPGMLWIWIAVESARGERRERLSADGLALAGALAAILLNPAGWHLFTYPFTTMRDPLYMANILEWTPPTYFEQPEFFWWTGATIIAGLIGWRAWRSTEAVAAILTTALAFMSRRHIPLAVIAIVPPLVRGLAGRISATSSRWLLAPGPVLAAGSLFLAVSHGEALRLGLRDDLYPVAAMAPLAALTSVVPGPAPIKIFALHRWGGYLTWNLPPRFKLFIDGRQLVYGPRLFEEYCRITMAAPNASALLARYAPDVVLVEHDSGVAGLLASTRTYALVHWDDACRMYVRRAAVPAAWLRAHTFLAAVPNPAPGGSPNTILGELDRAAAESPADARPWVIRADLLAQLGRLDEAGRAAGEAVRRRPEAIPALLSACRIAALRHATAAAEGFAASAERSDRTAAAPQLALARLAIDRGDHATAERRLATAIRLGNSATVRLERPDPAVHDGWALRAAEAGVTGHRVDAANAWREAGNASYRAGDLGEALRCYRAGLAADPANARLLHNLAATLTGLHRTAEARTAWERVRAVNPADADARHILTPEAPPARQ